MAKKVRYREGQRWTFSGAITEFENTLVIGRAIDAHPEWGWNEPKYEVYVRFSQTAKDHIPVDYDGVILGLDDAGMERSVTTLVERGVELPWWWVYGRRFKRKKDAPNSLSVLSCDSVRSVLRHQYDAAVRRAEDIRDRAEALRLHEEKYGKLKKKPKPSKSVAESWARIEAWYAEHGPGPLGSLAKGATKSAVDKFEREIGAKLPDDFKESVRIHDGGGWWVPHGHGELLSLEEILSGWKMYAEWQVENGFGMGDDWKPREIKGPAKNIWWNKQRIHITDNSGDHLTLDLDPSPDGRYGQVLDHSHEVGPTEVVASSWGEFLSNLAVGLESGKFIYSKCTGLSLLEYFKVEE